MWEVDGPVIASKELSRLGQLKNTEAWQMFIAELSVGSAPVPIWAGVDMDVNGTSRINVDLLVEAGDRGGGALVPGGCSRTLLVFFYCLGDVGEATRWYFFSAGG